METLYKENTFVSGCVEIMYIERKYIRMRIEGILLHTHAHQRQVKRGLLSYSMRKNKETGAKKNKK